MMWTQRARPFLAGSLFLYSLAVLTTMAGMEIFGWLSFALVLAWLVTEARSKRDATTVAWLPRPVLEKSDWTLLALMVVIILSALIAAPDGSDRVFIIGNARFVPLFIFLRFGFEYLGTERVAKGFCILVGCMGLIALYAIFQHFTGIDYIRGHREPVSKVFFYGVLLPDGTDAFAFRSRGMWGHPVTFGHSMALSFCMILGAALMWPWKMLGKKTLSKFKVLAIFVALFAGASIIYSYTRGAWLAMAAAIFVMVMYLGRKTAVTAIVAVAVTLGIGLTTSEKFRSRVESITSLTNQSNSERLDVWRANVAMFKDHPILGVGYGANEDLITQYYDKLGIKQEFGGHAHNNYLQFLSGTGLLGFLAYTVFSILMFWMAHRLLRTLPKQDHVSRTLALGALGAQVALHVGGLTECNFKDAEVNHQYMLILAILTVIWRHSRRSLATPKSA